jgi:hypothetical protein
MSLIEHDLSFVTAEKNKKSRKTFRPTRECFRRRYGGRQYEPLQPPRLDKNIISLFYKIRQAKSNLTPPSEATFNDHLANCNLQMPLSYISLPACIHY